VNTFDPALIALLILGFVGAEYLRGLGFPEAIFKAVEMHVSGKRFLTSEYRGDDGEKYYEHLTPVSKVSLKLQGGPFA